MTTTDHGPGVTWLASRAGIPPEQLLRDGTALMGALEGAARDAIDLGARLMSTDPAVQSRAEAEARALRAKLATPSGGPTPEERFRAKSPRLWPSETNRPSPEAGRLEWPHGTARVGAGRLLRRGNRFAVLALAARGGRSQRARRGARTRHHGRGAARRCDRTRPHRPRDARRRCPHPLGCGRAGRRRSLRGSHGPRGGAANARDHRGGEPIRAHRDALAPWPAQGQRRRGGDGPAAVPRRHTCARCGDARGGPQRLLRHHGNAATAAHRRRAHALSRRPRGAHQRAQARRAGTHRVRSTHVGARRCWPHRLRRRPWRGGPQRRLGCGDRGHDGAGRAVWREPWRWSPRGRRLLWCRARLPLGERGILSA